MPFGQTLPSVYRERLATNHSGDLVSKYTGTTARISMQPRRPGIAISKLHALRVETVYIYLSSHNRLTCSA